MHTMTKFCLEKYLAIPWEDNIDECHEFGNKKFDLMHEGMDSVCPHLKKAVKGAECGSPLGVMMADTLSFNAKIGVVNF